MLCSRYIDLYLHGIVPISEIKVGDLVLGTSGKYREVTETFAYNQHDAMVAVTPKHSLYPIYSHCRPSVLCNPKCPRRTIDLTDNGRIKNGTLKTEWVEAGQLQKGDYIAQVIPQEIVPVPEIPKKMHGFTAFSSVMDTCLKTATSGEFPEIPFQTNTYNLSALI